MWQCTVDDPVFENINGAQWRWYAHMIAAEEEETFKGQLDLVEYLASFTNADGVRKVRDYRERKENPHLDEELKDAVESGDYKENPLLKALQKIRENANLTDNDVESMRPAKVRRVKAPIDLDELAKKTRI
jgi:hypothetical protein